MRKLSRRQFLLILAAGTSMAMIGVARNGMSDDEFIIAILKAHMPFPNSERSIVMKFAKDYKEKYKAGIQQKVFAKFQYLYFSRNLRAFMPEIIKMRIQRFERSVITEFVLHSNAEKYFDGIDQTLVYYRLPTIQMCNPFATLRKA